MPQRIAGDATLVVTRPAHDAASLVDALVGRGRVVVALPVIGIEPVVDAGQLVATMADLERYRLVVFVSPNAIRRSMAHRRAPWPTQLVVGVMGPGSVETLRTVGIAAPVHRVVSPRRADGGELRGDRFDSEALFAALDDAIGLSRGFDGRVLILKGNGGRPWLGAHLRTLGIKVDEVEAYRRVRPSVDTVTTGALERLFTSSEPTVFVVTSSEGVDNLVEMVVTALPSPGGAPVDAVRAWLLGCHVLAPHDRIAETARAAGFSSVSTCAPGDGGILAAIE